MNKKKSSSAGLQKHQQETRLWVVAERPLGLVHDRVKPLDFNTAYNQQTVLLAADWWGPQLSLYWVEPSAFNFFKLITFGIDSRREENYCSLRGNRGERGHIVCIFRCHCNTDLRVSLVTFLKDMLKPLLGVWRRMNNNIIKCTRFQSKCKWDCMFVNTPPAVSVDNLKHEVKLNSKP